jgi:hypothetical protein
MNIDSNKTKTPKTSKALILFTQFLVIKKLTNIIIEKPNNRPKYGKWISVLLLKISLNSG